MNLNPEQRSLRDKVRALWEQRIDTLEMSHVLQVTEYEIERALHQALDRRRSVVGTLKVAE